MIFRTIATECGEAGEVEARDPGRRLEGNRKQLSQDKIHEQGDWKQFIASNCVSITQGKDVLDEVHEATAVELSWMLSAYGGVAVGL